MRNYIQHIISSLIIVFATLDAKAQTTTENYISVKEYTVARTSTDPTINNQNMNVSVQYFDEFGKVVQQVELGFGPNFEDLIAPSEYDHLERLSKEYLPYPVSGTNDGALVLNYQEDQEAFYQNYTNSTSSSYGYTQYSYRPDPENLMNFQVGPGAEWNEGQGAPHGILRTSKPSESDVPYFLINDEGYIQKYGNQNDVWEEAEYDENQYGTITYTDKYGKIVLIKKQLTSDEWAQTYYVYDANQRLRFVLPPESTKNLQLDVPNDFTVLSSDYTVTSSTGKYMYMPGVTVTVSPNTTLNPELIIRPYALTEVILNDFSFEYRYDEKGRLTHKKLPGAEWIYYAYDTRDRLALSQDGNLRENNQWLFTKYDVLNRPVLKGLIDIQEDFSFIQQELNQYSIESSFEFRNNSTIGYTNRTYPLIESNDNYIEVNFYDDYNFGFASNSNYQFTAELSHIDFFRGTSGLITGQRTKNLSTSDWLNSITYYDNKKQLIQSISKNQLGGYDRSTSRFNFVGHLMETKTTHQTDQETHTIQRRYTYDHRQNLTKLEHKIDSDPFIVLFETEYNELGESIDKKLYSLNGTEFEQSVDYQYNIRGQLTKINNSNLDDGENDLWGMELAYANLMPGVNTSNAMVKYNGNISAMKWSDVSGNSSATQRGYQFNYDWANRIKFANHKVFTGAWANSTSYNLNNVTLDNNGNILSLQRDGDNTTLDDLSYTYQGNQLLSVDDISNNTDGFNDGNTSTADYAYDDNGNMVVDKNKGITNITYNHLNLPTEVYKSSGEYLRFHYNAEGLKLTMEVFDNSGQLLKRTDYVGEFIYETDDTASRNLELIQHEEGRIVLNAIDNDWEYQYHMKDHLGNTRVTFTTRPETYNFELNYESSINLPDDEEFFEKLNNIVSSNLHDHTDAGSIYTHTQKLTGADGAIIGSVITLPVSKGDKISASVYAKFKSESGSDNPTMAVGSILSNLLSGGITSLSESTLSSSFGSSGSMVTNVFTDDVNSLAPKAFINLMFIAESPGSTIPESHFAFDQVAQDADATHDQLSIDGYTAPLNGYVVIYLSNETEYYKEVFFDELEVNINESPIIQTDDYYPYGLTYNSYLRFSANENDFLFNEGSERITDLNIEYDQTQYRWYDPGIGRWLQLDPKLDQFDQEDDSPYSYSLNNPILYNDPLGDCVPYCGIILKYATFKNVYLKSDNGAFVSAITGSSNSNPSNQGGAPTQLDPKIVGTVNDASKSAQTVSDNGATIVNEVSKDGLAAASTIATGAELTGVPALRTAGTAANAVINAADEARQVKFEGKNSEEATISFIADTGMSALLGSAGEFGNTVAKGGPGEKVIQFFNKAWTFLVGQGWKHGNKKYEKDENEQN